VLFSEPGAAGRWLRVGRELRERVIDSLWLSYENPQVVLASTVTELWRSADGGQSWELVPQVAGGMLGGHRSAPDEVWCAQAGSLWHSADRGATWLQRSTGEWRQPVAVAVGDGAAALALASAEQLWMSADHGRTWREAGRAPSPITGLSVAEASGGWYVTAGRLYHVSEQGWTEDTSAPEARGAVALLGGRQPTVLLALAEGGVARRTDGAWEWVGLEGEWGGGPAVILAAPYHLDTAFAGGQAVVALSSNRGRSWSVLRDDLPMVRALAAGRLL
jgi:hypothetical protein